MRKNKKLKEGEVITNTNIKCKFCRNGNCKSFKVRPVLQNFKEVKICKKTLNVLEYTKGTD